MSLILTYLFLLAVNLFVQWKRADDSSNNSTAVRINSPNQFVPTNTNPREVLELRKSVSGCDVHSSSKTHSHMYADPREGEIRVQPTRAPVPTSLQCLPRSFISGMSSITGPNYLLNFFLSQTRFFQIVLLASSAEVDHHDHVSGNAHLCAHSYHHPRILHSRFLARKKFEN